jgi:farnesyl-diphosphate farnesyltransferase
MTLNIKDKEPLLRNFRKHMETDGWTFDKNGPNEKDRELLVHFDQVIIELKKVKKPYYDIIADITVKMGNGMADYATNAEFNAGVNTIEEYELYCHYVAGLVGEGLTRLFVESKLANPALQVRMHLTESMGQFLQKTNIIRDVHEDFLDGRRFWPRQIWGKYVDKWDDLFLPENQPKAIECNAEMVLNALKHADECLFYMAGIRDQSVFNFVAIPQSMAIATLEMVFRNPKIFNSHLKITKGDACQLMLESTQNLRVVCDVFRRYVRRIHKKNDPRSHHFLAISAQCGKVCCPLLPSDSLAYILKLTTLQIEQFIESIYPSQTPETAAEGRKVQRPAEPDQPSMSTSEAAFLLLAVVGILLIVGGLMVR